MLFGYKGIYFCTGSVALFLGTSYGMAKCTNIMILEKKTRHSGALVSIFLSSFKREFVCQ